MDASRAVPPPRTRASVAPWRFGVGTRRLMRLVSLLGAPIEVESNSEHFAVYFNPYGDPEIFLESAEAPEPGPRA